MAYDPSGNWLDEGGRNLGQPQWTNNNGGFWFTLNADQNDFVKVPAPPTNPNTDPRGPGGSQTTADPLHAGTWYRDDNNVSGGLERIDAQGNVVGTYGSQGPSTQGGSGWNLNQADPATGGPSQVNYPSEAGGLFGLGDVWGSVVGAAMIAAIGTGAYFSIPAAAAGAGGAEAGAAGGAAAGSVGAGEAAGLSGEGALWGAAGAAPEVIASPLPVAGAEGFTGAAIGAGELGPEAGAVGGTAGDFAAAGGATGEGAAAGSGGFGSLLSTYGSSVGAAGSVAGAGSQMLGGGSGSGDFSGTGTTDPGGGGTFGSGGDATNWLQTVRTLAPVLGPAISGVGSLVGGGIQAGAAKDAATIQANAARDANLLLAQIYGQQRADQLPYLASGYNALGQINAMPNFSEQPYAYNAPAPLNPAQYQFAPPSGQDVLNQDPGYSFRVSEGLKALQNSAAARGGLLSGGTMKGIQRFGQDLASTEYGQAYNRALTQNQLGFERAQGQNEAQYQRGLAGNQMQYARALTSYGTNLARLQGLSGTGQTASGILANAAGQYGSGAAGNLTSAGAATAAGRVGQANAVAGGISGVGGAANSYLSYSLLSDLLNRKTT